MLEKKPRSQTAQMLRRSYRFQYILVFEGLLVGAAAGTLAILYRLALDYAERIMRWWIGLCQGKPAMVTLWFLILACLGLAVGWLVRREPMISGSGIPQVSGEVKGYLQQNWLRVILCKVSGGILCILGGLSLGREGPSVQLGAMAGKGVSRLLGRMKTEEKYLITCGAGAGLAAAFNAPLAGIMFSLEEIHKNFSASALVSVMVAAVTADFISKNVFGLSTVFHFSLGESLPLRYYWLLLLLGVLLGALGAFYNAATLWTQSLYQKLRLIPQPLRILLPFLMAGVLSFTLPQVLGGGHAMIELLASQNPGLGLLLLLLAVKFLFSLFSFGSGAPGGIFFPLLVLGAYIGGAFGLSAVQWLGIDPGLINNFIIIAMAGYFTAIVRAPITGIILIAEMSGSLHHLLSLAVVSIVAYLVAYLLRSKPIYESLLSRILRRQGIAEEEHGGKVLSEAVVEHGCAVEGRCISELSWPRGCLVVAIRRGGEELIPRGDTVLMASDTIVLLANQEEQTFVEAQLLAKCRAST